MKLWQPFLIVMGMLAVALVGTSTHEAQGGKKVDTRVFEMRTYYAVPGKMAAVNARFRDHTCKLLEKHGMTLIGFWNPTDPKKSEEVLFYIVAHASKEAADKSWAAFRKDPAWIAARNASEKDGKILTKVESVFMNPTDYSAIK